ncbi:hypothetical protein GJU40_07510 [Bacillus lacus]|uniref:SCP2 domain-containing protein n=1 Tax=Metabacillus lacus TaxID=1983721 RepID=A0A7X2IY91_9BACI|nr:hypothetical protein [Metabacillus lacus]MRX72017.1 hypothetical protein [Metabacillus lacus]
MTLEAFLHQVNSINLLVPLLPAKNLLVELQFPDEKHTLVFCRDGIASQASGYDQPDISIVASGITLEEILWGSLRIRQLHKLGLIEMKGSYRNILKLESILSLSL